MQRILLFVAFLLIKIQLAGQVKTIDQQLLWLGIGVDADITSKFSVGVFSEERRFVFPLQRQQRVLIDVHANYESNEMWANKVGLWLFEISEPQNPFDAYLGEVKETRPYHSITYTKALENGCKWQFSLMSEYRIFRPVGAESYFDGPLLREDLRERFKIAYMIGLGKKTTFTLADELHLTVYSSGVQPVFNQNRVMAIVKRNFGKGFSATGGYIFWFQPTANSAEYFARHIASVRLNYRFKI